MIVFDRLLFERNLSMFNPKICFSFRPRIFVKLYFLTNPNVIVNIEGS